MKIDRLIDKIVRCKLDLQRQSDRHWDEMKEKNDEIESLKQEIKSLKRDLAIYKPMENNNLEVTDV